mmetsp:Transcript_44029/g.90931  ORF Transcript_44029/g.90931 Transcript_44029/m.90931 type:complete len:201 (+) Transcript_44029:386-988(+)
MAQRLGPSSAVAMRRGVPQAPWPRSPQRPPRHRHASRTGTSCFPGSPRPPLDESAASALPSGRPRLMLSSLRWMLESCCLLASRGRRSWHNSRAACGSCPRTRRAAGWFRRPLRSPAARPPPSLLSSPGTSSRPLNTLRPTMWCRRPSHSSRWVAQDSSWRRCSVRRSPSRRIVWGAGFSAAFWSSAAPTPRLATSWTSC